MVMHPRTSSPALARPASASDLEVKRRLLKNKHESVQRPSSSAGGGPVVAGRVSHSRQVVFPPWGYHAGCHGSPVIMSTRPGPQGGGKSDKRFGFDRKRMLLPSPAFGFANTSGAPSNQTKPQSRSQTSMSYYSNEYQQQQPWYSGSRAQTPDLQNRESSTQTSQQKIHFRRSSLPIRSQAGSPAPGQNPNPGQRSRNSSGTQHSYGAAAAMAAASSSTTGGSNERRPPLMSSTSFSGRLPFHTNQQFEVNLSGLMVTSMKLYERPKGNNAKQRSTNENHPSVISGSVESRLKSSFNAKTSNPNSRRGSLEAPIPPIFNSVTDEENEMFLNQAAEIDEKFYLKRPTSPNSSNSEMTPQQPKVEMFVKIFNHEELEDIEGSDEEDCTEYEK